VTRVGPQATTAAASFAASAISMDLQALAQLDEPAPAADLPPSPDVDAAPRSRSNSVSSDVLMAAQQLSHRHSLVAVQVRGAGARTAR
jgi:hypothetical protein